MLILYGFLTMFCGLSALVIKKLPEDKKIRYIRRFDHERTAADIKKTDPFADVLSESTKFITHKFIIALLVMCAGSFLAFMYELKEFNTNELIDGYLIKRNGYEETGKKVNLLVSSTESDDSEAIEVSVNPQRFADEELDIMASEAEGILCDIMMGENESLDMIITDMNFPSAIEGYPFKLSWRTDDPLLLNNKGVIDKDRLNSLRESTDIYEGVLTGIHVELIYEDYLRETDFYARVYPSDKDGELTLSEYINELILETDEATKTEEYLILPDTAGDVSVTYEEIHDKNAFILLAMTIVLAAGVYYREDKELEKRVKERDRQLIEDYPGMVNKFVLFYSAGLTTRGIWSKLCKDYRVRTGNGEEKRYLYEEMLICEGRMNEGLGEISAYEGFAADCGLHKYRQFISLVGQAIGKGRSDILPLLEREAMDAFAERKNRARELGEEAGTKLLFPMLMMLLTVLIIVMVPAFISFRM